MRARRPLINNFAPVAGQDRLTVYRSLVTADRDVIGIRAATESSDGSPELKDGANLANGSRGMILAAACSLQKPQRIYVVGRGCPLAPRTCTESR